VAVAAELLQSSDASRFWGNVVGLLYAAAAAHDAETDLKVRGPSRRLHDAALKTLALMFLLQFICLTVPFLKTPTAGKAVGC
jgi:hypothetical protein